MNPDTSLHDVGVRIYDRWTALWNQNLDLAADIMASQFKLRYAQAGGEAFDAISRPAELARLIEAWHRERPGMVFKAEGPVLVNLTDTNGRVQGLVARPYLVRFCVGDDETIERSGTDILAVLDGLISEVWSVSGGLQGRTFYSAA